MRLYLIFFTAILPFHCLAIDCDSSPTEEYGYVKSPNFPDHYPNDVTCHVKLVPHPGARIVMSVNDFETQYGRDELKIYYDGNLQFNLSGSHVDHLSFVYGGVIDLVFTSDSSFTGKGFRLWYALSGHYHCNKTETRGYGAIKSPNYPMNYPNDVTCHTKLSPKPGSRVDLEFRSFQTESDNDIVMIFIDDELRYSLSGSRGKGLLIQHNGTVDIFFTSNSNNTDKGFSARYVFVDAPQCDAIHTEGSGTVTSPNYPNDYPNKTTCYTYLSPRPGYLIELDFTDFQTEPIIDRVEIYFDEWLHSIYSGSSGDGVHLRHNGVITLAFKSDFSVSKKGFTANYVFTEISTPLVQLSATSPQTTDVQVPSSIDTTVTTMCDFTAREGSGTITSPNYPSSYPTNTVCVFRLLPKTGHKVHVKFTDIKTEYDKDAIQIYYGDKKRAYIQGPFRTGSQYQYEGGIYIIFNSDSHYTNRGFSANYEFSRATECDFSANGGRGVLTSPNFPNPYPREVTCNMTLTPKPGYIAKLLFTYFSINHEVHTLKIYLDGQLNQTLTGYLDHGTVLQHEGVIKMVFTSDYNYPYKGFSAQYEFVPSPSQSSGTVLTTGCNLSASNGNGTVTTPNYPLDYPNLVFCIIRLVPNAGYMGRIVFTDFETQRGKDKVVVYSNSVEITASLSGTEGQGQQFDVDTSILIVFVSDISATARGFSADYEFYVKPRDPVPKPAACDVTVTSGRGILSTPNYPGYYPKDTTCTYRLQPVPGQIVRVELREYMFSRDEQVLELFYGDDKQTLSGAKYVHNDSMTFVFTTNSSTEFRGANIYYEFADCGRIITDDEGYFTTPNFPGYHTRNITCIWAFRPHTSRKYKINSHFVGSAENDFLKYIDDGYWTMSPTVGYYSSRKTYMKYIIYRSDEHTPSRGFEMAYN